MREAKVAAAGGRPHAEARHPRRAAVEALDRPEPEAVVQERLIEAIHIGGGGCDAAGGIDPRRMRRGEWKGLRRRRQRERRSRHPGRAEDVTLHHLFIRQCIHLLKYGAQKDRVRIAVLESPNAVPWLDERQERFHARGSGTSVLVRRSIQVIRQTGNVLRQLVESRRRLRVGEESIDLVAARKPARLFADEYGARGDWLGQRGDAIEGIFGRRPSRRNLSASSFE